MPQLGNGLATTTAKRIQQARNQHIMESEQFRTMRDKALCVINEAVFASGLPEPITLVEIGDNEAFGFDATEHEAIAKEIQRICIEGLFGLKGFLEANKAIKHLKLWRLLGHVSYHDLQKEWFITDDLIADLQRISTAIDAIYQEWSEIEVIGEDYEDAQ